jgi:predicted adenine nucleotide alpha hydrolase (AANH) superfamily ATPase
MKRFQTAEKKQERIPLSQDESLREDRPRVLLHSCCGPCSTTAVERLARAYQVTVFFFNPNITDEEEYKRRAQAQREFVDRYNASSSSLDRIHLVLGPYEPNAFLNRIKGYEDEPEGGARCTICFLMRMEKACEYALMHGIEAFTTSLSVSPHKDINVISKIGKDLSLKYGVTFLAEDFKKQNGFVRSVELAKTYELYRQDYCGCIFSKMEREAQREEKEAEEQGQGKGGER